MAVDDIDETDQTDKIDEMDKAEDQKKNENLRTAFIEAERDINPDIAHRLASARREAVAVADRRNVWQTPMAWGLSGTAAAAVLAYAIMTPGLLEPGTEGMPPLDQPEFVVAQDAELLEELEFVAWMMAMEESGEAPVSS